MRSMTGGYARSAAFSCVRLASLIVTLTPHPTPPRRLRRHPAS
jgi:hypothetical protein